jgi:hypothetical protein
VGARPTRGIGVASLERTRVALLSDWLRDAHRARHAHSEAASHYARLDLWLGGTAVVLAAVIGTSVFATLGQPLPTVARVSAALITFAAAALSGFQTFLKAAAQAEAHRQASHRYEGLVREIEQLEVDPPASEEEADREFDRVRSGFYQAGDSAPQVPARSWARVERRPDAGERR